MASQLTAALTSIEAQLCDMEAKGLMRSDGMTAQKAFELVASFDDLQKALDGALYVQVCFRAVLDGHLGEGVTPYPA